MKLRPWIHALRTAALIFLFAVVTFLYTSTAVECGIKIGFKEALKRLPPCIESGYQS